MGVDKTADAKTMKKAYRKLALSSHPDKAPLGQEEEYKAKFQVLNEAYEILSDPNERAWYDAHREQILTGKSKEEMETQSGFLFDIDSFLSEDCFAGKDFYEVYQEAFMKIKLEEETARENHQPERDSPLKMANFGDASSDEEMVKGFYREWENFSTCKIFAFADMYNPKDYEERRIKRLIDKENKKFRNEARKAYLAKIKKLVTFVKARDVRWKDIVRKEVQRKAKKEREDQFAEIKREKEWQERKKRLMEEELKNYGEFSDKEDDIALTNLEEYFCKVCNKEFKTEGALKHHNRSKQHLKRKKKIMQELMLEGDEDMLRQLEKEIEESENRFAEEDKTVKENVGRGKKKKKRRRKKEEKKMEEPEEDSNLEKPEENQNNDKVEEKASEPTPQMSESKNEFEDEDNKKSKKKRRRRKKKEAPMPTVQPKTEPDTKFMSKKMKRKLKKQQRDEKDKLTCRECKLELPTRNALFAHLKDIHKFKW